MKNLLFISVLIAFLTFGCDKDNLDDPNTVKEGTGDGNIAQAVIGRGYDISGRFAYSEDIKEAVLDFKKLSGEGKIIKDGNIAETVVQVIEGETIQEYQAGFNYARSTTAGIEGVFSAEVGLNFGYERAQSSGYSFATVSSFTYKYGMYVDGRLNPASLSAYASEQFLSDAVSMDIENFIKTYGTHVVVGGKWGASFSYSMCAQRISVSNQYSFSAFTKAEATISGINLGGSQEISAEFGTYYESSTKNITTKAKGGDSEYALSIAAAETAEGLDAAYTAWVSSIDENPAFCDYYQEGLVPIYEFIADESTKSKIKTGIENYLAEKGIESVLPEEKTITDNFQAVNFCHTMSGDSEIDADGGGDIYVEITFTIGEQIGELNGNNLELKINMKVYEMKGDYSKLEGTTTVTIVNNDPINSIELPNTVYTFNIQEAFNPDDGQYFDPNLFIIDPNNKFPDWLNNVTICIDGSGGDEAIIGVKGDVSIPVTVFPTTK